MLYFHVCSYDKKKDKNQRDGPVDCSLFSRKLQICFTGRSSDSLPLLNAFPASFNQASGFVIKKFMELTAAGTVAGFHGIPF